MDIKHNGMSAASDTNTNCWKLGQFTKKKDRTYIVCKILAKYSLIVIVRTRRED